jgi:hypothetical protein
MYVFPFEKILCANYELFPFEILKFLLKHCQSLGKIANTYLSRYIVGSSSTDKL